MILAEELYRENILDHYQNPRNYGRLTDYSFRYQDFNPLCGDQIEIFVKLSPRNRIEKIKFEGQGCAISQAAASLLTAEVKKKSLAEVQKMGQAEVLAWLGVAVGASRLKCALLSLRALQKGIIKYLKSK